MKRWIKNSKKGMAVLGAVAFMLVAGWQFGVSGTEVVFSDTEVALENAVEGSIDPPNQPGIHCRCHSNGVCYGGNQYSFRKLCNYSVTGSANCSDHSSNCPN